MRWILSSVLVFSMLSPAAACPVQKMRFSQATGCQNDGSIEFCVPKKDRQLLERLRKVAPNLRNAPGARGRAGCDTNRETLYFFDTRPEQECVGETEALTDAAWEKVCRIAAEPGIQRIVPTWYE